MFPKHSPPLPPPQWGAHLLSPREDGRLRIEDGKLPDPLPSHPMGGERELELGRNDAVEKGERDRPGRCPRRLAEDFYCARITLKGEPCLTLGWSAGRRPERPGRSRSPITTESFRLSLDSTRMWTATSLFRRTSTCHRVRSFGAGFLHPTRGLSWRGLTIRRSGMPKPVSMPCRRRGRRCNG